MEQKVSEQYLKNIQMIFECRGKLVSLTEIYNDYGRPKNLSPKRIIRMREYKELIDYQIKKTGYSIDKVIKYTQDDILVDRRIAIRYLENIDIKNFVRSMYTKQLLYWTELLEQEEISN
jgi:hypothetical protein